jgi:hypothetical protein
MQIAVRPPVKAAIAALGVSALAIAPITVAPPDSKMTAVPAALSSTSVNLTAAVNPITAWVDVFTDAFDNVGTIGGAILADPAPAVRQVLENLLGYGETVVGGVTGSINAAVGYFGPEGDFWEGLKTSATLLSEGNISGALFALSSTLIAGPVIELGMPLFGILTIPGQIVQNAANVVQALTSVQFLLPITLSALGPVMATIGAIGDQLQGAFDSLGAGNFIDAVVNLINIPAAVVGAALNGYVLPDDTPMPGLLTAGPFIGGLVQTLLVTLPQTIAGAIAPSGLGIKSLGLPGDGGNGAGYSVPEDEGEDQGASGGIVDEDGEEVDDDDKKFAEEVGEDVVEEVGEEVGEDVVEEDGEEVDEDDKKFAEEIEKVVAEIEEAEGSEEVGSENGGTENGGSEEGPEDGDEDTTTNDDGGDGGSEGGDGGSEE